ncbi:MAG: ATP-binding protein [Bacilli bacterium]
MSKVSVDIEYIKVGLKNIGYEISDCLERTNNGTNWQIKFSNSGAIITIYDSNRVHNTVINGKLANGETKILKKIVDGLKCKEFEPDPLNAKIIKLIRSNKEDFDYDFKQCMYSDNETLLHDILCLSNNLKNKDAYLILGVTDNYSVVGVDEKCTSNNVFDFLKKLKFVGGNLPEIEIKNLFYTYKKLVIICKSSKNVPFYLTEKYRSIDANRIYTRIGDTNTPKNQHASYSDVEKLWRIHFEREKE